MVAELSGVDVFLGGHVLLAGAALRADLENRAWIHRAVSALLVHGVQQHVRRIHVLGDRLLAVGVAAGFDRVYRVLRVLEVGSGDDDRIKPEAFLGLVKLYVARKCLDVVAKRLLHLRLRVLVETLPPEVGNGDHFEIELLVVVQEARQKRIAEAIGITDACDAYLLVCTGGVKRRSVTGGDYAGETGGSLAEFTTIDCFH